MRSLTTRPFLAGSNILVETEEKTHIYGKFVAERFETRTNERILDAMDDRLE